MGAPARPKAVNAVEQPARERAIHDRPDRLLDDPIGRTGGGHQAGLAAFGEVKTIERERGERRRGEPIAGRFDRGEPIVLGLRALDPAPQALGRAGELLEGEAG